MKVSKGVFTERLNKLESYKSLIFNHLILNINTPNVVIEYSSKLKDVQIKINDIEKLLK